MNWQNFLRRLRGVLVLSLGAAAVAWPQAEYDILRISTPGYTFNARSLGMGNAYSTIGGDYSAVRINPASLGLVDSSWSYGASINTNAFPGTSKYNEIEQYFSTTSTTFSQLGLSIPIRGETSKYVLALGYNQSKDFNQSLKYGAYNAAPTSFLQSEAQRRNAVTRALGLSFPVNDPVTGEYIQEGTLLQGNMDESGFMLDRGGLLHFSIGGAAQLVEGVFVGGSANFNTGTYLSDREYYEVDSKDVYGAVLQMTPGDARTAGFQQAYIHDVRSSEYMGWDFKLGFLYKFYNFIAISGAFKIPMTHTITEIQSVSGYAEYAPGRVAITTPIDQETKYKITTPYEVTAGAMVNLWILTGTLEATYVDYTQMQVVDGLDLQDRAATMKRIKSELTPVLNINGGAEFRLPFTGLSARAGFMYRPSPVKNDPAEYDTKVVTAGLGINSSDRLRLDVGYALGFWTQRGLQYGVEGIEQEVVTHDVMVSIGFSF